MNDSDAPFVLIRTGLRDKLPRGLSHPVGAEAISRALQGCPRYDELWTAFGSRPRPLHPMPAECAHFRLAFAVSCSNYSDGWHLSVPAVPSEERAVVRQLLIASGLPSVREWLCRPRSETWHEGYRLFQVGYMVEPLCVCFVESHNRRVVGSSVVTIDGIRAEAEVPAEQLVRGVERLGEGPDT
jgi:hypothetical protein